jgi:DHA1 family multidrug resistance protein-like MFS transporter
VPDARQERRNLVILWLGTFLTAVSFSLVMPFLPLLLQDLGVRQHLESWTGVAFSATFLTAALFSPLWGSLADQVGRKPMIVRSGLAIAALYLGMAYARSPVHVVGLRLLNGALSGFIPAAFALLATTVPPARLGRSLAVLQAGPAAGSITGPLLGGALVQLWGIRPTLRLAAAAVFAATLLVVWGVREPAAPRGRTGIHVLDDLRQALGDAGLRRLFGLALLMQVGTTAVEPLITIYVGQFPGTRTVPFLSGFLFSLVGLATVMWAPYWGRVGERVGFASLLPRSLLATAAGTGLQLWAPTLWIFGAVRFAIGTSYAAATPALNTLVAVSVRDAFRGRAFGLLNSVQMLGNLVGPLVGGVWGDAWGIRSNFAFSAAVFLVAAAVAAGGRADPTASGISAAGAHREGRGSEAMAGPAPDAPPAFGGPEGPAGPDRPQGVPARGWEIRRIRSPAVPSRWGAATRRRRRRPGRG